MGKGCIGKPMGKAQGTHGNKTFTLLILVAVSVSPLHWTSAEAQTFTEFPVPTSSSNPSGIARATDGNIWFTEQAMNKIGRILVNSPNTITEFTVPTANSQPVCIAAGSDGNLWFTERNGNKVGRILANSPNTLA